MKTYASYMILIKKMKTMTMMAMTMRAAKEVEDSLRCRRTSGEHQVFEKMLLIMKIIFL